MGQYGDCKVGAQEESSSNLLQGEAGSVEVHQRGSQCDASSSRFQFGRGELDSSVVLKPKHLLKAVRNVEATAQPSLTAALTNAVQCIKDILILA